jgi:uracil-DNA glycosylase
VATDTDNAQLPAEELIPEQLTIESLREAAAGCKACDLWEKATQTVFGEGKGNARLMLVGEQPGDREDIEGHPFVGPAGRILDQALEAAGIARARLEWRCLPPSIHRRSCGRPTAKHVERHWMV